jgi:hypothetical protein
MDMPPGKCNLRSIIGVTANAPGAEIRNRIYHFAIERDDFEGWEDPVALLDVHAGHGCGTSQWPMSRVACYRSGRSFLGLTQTCRIIRREYRPIWLRTSSIRVQPSRLVPYIHTFYGCRTTEYSNLPKLVQISYDHRWQENVDLTQMLRMRAHCPATKFEFIPHMLTLDEGPWIDFMDECELCEEEMMDGEIDMDEFEEYGCTHEHIHREVFADGSLDEYYSYIYALNLFLAHGNAKWLKDIRDCDVTRVKLDISDGGYDHPEVTIRLSSDSDIVTKELSKKSMLVAASDYVKDRDLRSTTCTWSALHFQIQICGGMF